MKRLIPLLLAAAFVTLMTGSSAIADVGQPYRDYAVVELYGGTICQSGNGCTFTIHNVDNGQTSTVAIGAERTYGPQDAFSYPNFSYTLYLTWHANAFVSEGNVGATPHQLIQVWARHACPGGGFQYSPTLQYNAQSDSSPRVFGVLQVGSACQTLVP